MPPSWQVEKLDAYIQCPLKYKFRYLDKAPERLRLYTVLEKLLVPMFFETIERRGELNFNDPEPMMAEVAVRAKLIQQDLAVTYSGISRVLLAAARRMYVRWYLQQFPHWSYCGANLEVTSSFGRGSQRISLEGIVPFTFNNAIQLVRFSSMKRIMPSISDILLAACANSPNVRLLLFTTKNLGMKWTSTVISKSQFSFAIDAAKRAVQGIKRNFFCPTHPFSHTCDSAYCTFFTHCKKHRFSAKSI